MTRKINLVGKARVEHTAGKANTFKMVAPKKAATKTTAKVAKGRGKRQTVSYQFSGSTVYGALKYLAENGLFSDRDNDFGMGLTDSIVAQGVTSDRRFFYAKKLCLKKAHRDALIEAGFDLGSMMQEQYVAPKRTAADYVTVSGTFDRMSDSGAAFRCRINGRMIWVPVSQCQFGKAGLDMEPHQQVTFKVAKWLADKNELVAGG